MLCAVAGRYTGALGFVTVAEYATELSKSLGTRVLGTLFTILAFGRDDCGGIRDLIAYHR
jgi:hypothetical protein